LLRLCPRLEKPQMTILILIVVGLATGSFLGALTYRLPRRQSIASGRSKCDHCGSKIAWYDNIPLLSYINLRGKCRSCGKKISLRYPAIESTSALVFVASGIFLEKCSPLLQSPLCSWFESLGYWIIPFLAILISLMIAIFVIDLETKIIPDELSLTGFLLVFIFLIFANKASFSYLASGLAASLFLLIIHLVTGGKGMGLGDVKLALFLGAFLGWPYTLTWLFLSFVIGAVVGIFLILFGRAKFGRQIPFGPFLIFSGFLVLFFGRILVGILPF